MGFHLFLWEKFLFLGVNMGCELEGFVKRR